MEFHIEDVEIDKKMEDLQLSFPTGIAFFPENFEIANESSEFIFPEPIAQIGKVFKSKDIIVEVLGNNLGSLRSRKSADIYLPALYFGASLMIENPTVVSVALNVLSNYITDFLKGTFGQKQISIEIYVKKNHKTKIQKISYKGNAEGIRSLGEVIKKLN